jgi:hypothetical protein
LFSLLAPAQGLVPKPARVIPPSVFRSLPNGGRYANFVRKIASHPKAKFEDSKEGRVYRLILKAGGKLGDVELKYVNKPCYRTADEDLLTVFFVCKGCKTPKRLDYRIVDTEFEEGFYFSGRDISREFSQDMMKNLQNHLLSGR